MNRRIITLVELTLALLSVIALTIYFYVSLSRIAYPFTIEWTESNTFMPILRVLQGKPIYSPPSYDFVPTTKTPLYYYIVALFSKLTGQIMFSMRLVSVLASLSVFITIYALCRVRQISPLTSIGAVGLFAASYAVTGYWFDVGRVDSLFLALLLAGYLLTIIKTKQDNAVGVLAGFVVFLSFATKQLALLAVPFLLLNLILERRWMKTLYLGISFMLSWTIFVVTMNIVTKGWFWIYIYEIPSAHPFSWKIITCDFWNLYIFPKFPWLNVAILLTAIVLLIKRDKVGIFNYLVSIFTFLLPLSIMSIATIAKQWGYINGLLPIVAALSVIGVEAYQRIMAIVTSSQNGAWTLKVLYYLISMLMVFQFIALRYDFRTQIPTSDTLESGYRILGIIRDSKTPIFIPTSPYLLYMAGQPTHFHVTSLGDLWLASQKNPAIMEMSKKYMDRISQYLLSKSLQTVLLPNAKWYDKVFSIENGYACESLVTDYPPLITMTGAISYLDRICRFRGEAAK